jgi:heptosyltransferase-1
MKLLIVKMSSMGDIIHTLPALTDAAAHIQHLSVDWVVEEAFAEIPVWHPAVERVIPIAWRRWRTTPIQTLFTKEWRDFYHQLRHQQYDIVLDAQGLIKSSIVTRLSRGHRIGLDRRSLWEPLARWGYQQHCRVDPNQHAITRVKKLFAQALAYPYDEHIHYGVLRQQFLTQQTISSARRSLLFLHGTTWPTKLWPYEHWVTLARALSTSGYPIQIAYGNATEHQRAKALATDCPNIELLPPMGLTAIAEKIANAQAVVAVDTGLGHLAAALATPTISLYGPTQWSQVGTRGEQQYYLAAPAISCHRRCSRYCCARTERPTSACLQAITPKQVLTILEKILS